MPSMPKISYVERFNFSQQTWKPNSSYKFHPVVQAKRQRGVQRRWLDYTNVAFSHVEQGFFCKTCVLYGKNEVGKGNNNKAGRFVTEPYRRLKDFDVSIPKPRFFAKRGTWIRLDF